MGSSEQPLSHYKSLFYPPLIWKVLICGVLNIPHLAIDSGILLPDHTEECRTDSFEMGSIRCSISVSLWQAFSLICSEYSEVPHPRHYTKSKPVFFKVIFLTPPHKFNNLPPWLMCFQAVKRAIWPPAITPRGLERWPLWIACLWLGIVSKRR